MLRVVIDTSSLVSYALTRSDLTRRLVARWLAGDFILLSSPATRAELSAVLRRPKIRRMIVAPLDLVQALERFSEHTPGILNVSGACRDPKDDKFLACAIEGQAHYLVSSDRDLLDLRHYRGVAIVNPGQFLLALELHPLDPGTIAVRFQREVLEGIRSMIPLEPGTAARLERALGTLDDQEG